MVVKNTPFAAVGEAGKTCDSTKKLYNFTVLVTRQMVLFFRSLLMYLSFHYGDMNVQIMYML